jgi:excisionase family DNA binding protein
MTSRPSTQPPRHSSPGIFETRLLTGAEVAALFRVDPKTVARWAQQGKLHSIRTVGGHRRYSEAEIETLLGGAAQVPVPRPPSTNRTTRD